MNEQPCATNGAANREGRAAVAQALPGLYGLRGLAALAVTLFHLAPNVSVPSAFSFVQNYFGLGVQLFFVLSGFSLMHSTRGRVGCDGWLGDYLLKRLFRIAPAFYVMIVFFLLFNAVVWRLTPDVPAVLLNLAFVFNLLPGLHESIVWAGWTVGVEMIFYVVFPVLLLTIRSLTGALCVFVVATILAWAGRVAILKLGLPASYAHAAFAVNLVYFAGGILSYFAYVALRAGSPSTVSTALVAMNVAVFALAGVAASPLFVHLLTANLGGPFWAVFFSVFAISQAIQPWRVTTLPAFTACGERSYSIYLVHAVIVFLLTPAYAAIYAGLSGVPTVAFALSCALAIAVVIAAAEVLYGLVEQPGIRIGARFHRATRSTSGSTSLGVARA
jgi:peptidoglycan/LPS O-acetylase OafA/YrhL